MNSFERKLRDLIDAYVDERSFEELIDELFVGGITPGELVVEMYRNGMIPTEDLERFIDD